MLIIVVCTSFYREFYPPLNADIVSSTGTIIIEVIIVIGTELIIIVIEHWCNFWLELYFSLLVEYICGLFYRVFCLTTLKTHFKALLTRLIAFCVYWPMFDNKIDCRPVSGHLNGISLSLFEIHSRLVLFLLSGHLNRDTHLNLELRMSKNSSFITQLSSFEFALVYSARPQRSFGYEHRHSGRGVGLLWRIGLGLLSQQERSDCVYMGAVSAAPKP